MPDLFRADPPPAAPSTIPLTGESKGWIPTEHLDEISPPPRPTPNDWLVNSADGLRLVSAEDDGEPGRALTEGETVSFDELMVFPSVRAIWNGPGDYELLTPVAPGASMFWLPFDSDTIGTSIADFMRDNGENGAFEPGEEIEIDAYDHTEHEFVLRDGKFVAAEKAEVGHA